MKNVDIAALGAERIRLLSSVGFTEIVVNDSDERSVRCYYKIDDIIGTIMIKMWNPPTDSSIIQYALREAMKTAYKYGQNNIRQNIASILEVQE